jgi:hypothetical protein
MAILLWPGACSPRDLPLKLGQCWTLQSDARPYAGRCGEKVDGRAAEMISARPVSVEVPFEIYRDKIPDTGRSPSKRPFPRTLRREAPGHPNRGGNRHGRAITFDRKTALTRMHRLRDHPQSYRGRDRGLVQGNAGPASGPGCCGHSSAARQATPACVRLAPGPSRLQPLADVRMTLARSRSAVGFATNMALTWSWAAAVWPATAPTSRRRSRSRSSNQPRPPSRWRSAASSSAGEKVSHADKFVSPE